MSLRFTNRTSVPTSPLVEDMGLRAGNRRGLDLLTGSAKTTNPATHP
jgi:hypothetical protein